MGAEGVGGCRGTGDPVGVGLTGWPSRAGRTPLLLGVALAPMVVFRRTSAGSRWGRERAALSPALSPAQLWHRLVSQCWVQSGTLPGPCIWGWVTQGRGPPTPRKPPGVRTGPRTSRYPKKIPWSWPWDHQHPQNLLGLQLAPEPPDTPKNPLELALGPPTPPKPPGVGTGPRTT